MKIGFFENYKRRRINRVPYPRALKALKPGEGYIISNGRIVGAETEENIIKNSPSS
jgi:hypothetical protein